MSHKPSIVPTRGPSGRGAHSNYEHLATGLGWFSIGLGLVELITPRAFCRAVGLEGHETLVRAYGAREVATGVAILMSHDPTPWIYGRIAGDALDLATLAAGSEPTSHNGAAMATAAAIGVTILDAVCAQGLTADKRLSAPEDFDYRDRSGFPLRSGAMRGAARDFDVPTDFRVPAPLRPWREGETAPGQRTSQAT